MKLKSVQVIIPIKPLSLAKSRLASMLDNHTREALVLMMLDRVIRASTAVLSADACLVLGGDQVVRAMLLDHGIEPEEDNDGNLNDALWSAINLAKAKNYSATLILPADLPLLEPSDILEIIRASNGLTCHVCSPASQDGGTNAFFQPIGNGIKPMMGVASFSKHRSAIESLGRNFVILQRPKIGFDLDNETDYEWASQNIRGWYQGLEVWKSWLLIRKGLHG